MKKTLWILLALLVTACSAAEVQTLQATPRAGVYGAVKAVTPETLPATATPTPDDLATAYAVIAFDSATSTARAAATSTAFVVTSTQEAKATDQFWIGVTLQVATQHATETQIAKTQVAAEKTTVAATTAPKIATEIKSTQIVEETNLVTTVVSMWVWRVGFAVFVVGLSVVFVVILYRGIPIAENVAKNLGDARVMKEKTDALKPDANGRRPAVPSSLLKEGETLIIPEMAHRSAIDPHQDDLTAEQALRNAESLRQLEGVRSVSNSPFMSKYLARDMQKQGMTPYSVKVTKPEGISVPRPESELLPERETLPALPAPHYKKLFAWDGELKPFGVGEDGELMRVDPAEHPHLMVCGMSGSGKSRSAIRTLVACSLTQGDNVFVLGRQVDFYPFEEHPNFQIMPIRDLRTDSNRYIRVVRRMADEMDVRDDILVSKRQTTWDRYGAPQTVLLLDDFTGMMLYIPVKDRQSFLNELLRIAMDGRKYGLNLLLGVQRPTGDVFDTTLRSQFSRIAFRVEKESESKIAIDVGGAQYLPKHHFYTRITTESSLERGVGFLLEDGEAEAFWRSRPAEENEPMAWIEATAEPVIFPAPVAVTPETHAADLQAAYKVADDDFKITEVYLRKCSERKPFSLRSIESEVFSSTGGAAHDAVKAAIARLEAIDPEQVAGMLKDKFTEWKQEGATTIGATSPENDVFLPDSAPVAG